jgi:hypothetical protein
MNGERGGTGRMGKYSLVELVETVKARMGPERFREVVLKAAQEAAHRAGFPDVDQYLNHLGLRGRWRRALSKDRRTGEVVVVAPYLAHCIPVLQIPLETFIQVVPRPWDQWHPRSVLAVVIGWKLCQGPAEPHHPRWSTSGRDTGALASLVTLLTSEFGLHFRLELQWASPDMPAEQATELIEALRSRHDVGAVVALGSPVVNSVVEPLARLMLAGREASEPPARFRFTGNGTSAGSFLCDPPCRPEESGIRFINSTRTAFRRTLVEEVLRRAQSNDRGPFEDCGMLLIDARHRCPLIVCAGHGSCGTVAAVLALGQSYKINADLNRDDDELGRDRAFQIVTVRCHKASVGPVDDLYFDPEYGTGWDFGF